MLPASYTELIRYDGAAVQRDRRDRTVPCAIQPRDVEILADIWRYKFLTATQLLELHWPDCAPRVGRKRLAKLFHAGLIERFRPVTRTGGSFPWTYHLGHDGHRLLLADDGSSLLGLVAVLEVVRVRVVHEQVGNGPSSAAAA